MGPNGLQKVPQGVRKELLPAGVAVIDRGAFQCCSCTRLCGEELIAVIWSYAVAGCGDSELAGRVFDCVGVHEFAFKNYPSPQLPTSVKSPWQLARRTLRGVCQC